jgi:hypothetical protein
MQTIVVSAQVVDLGTQASVLVERATQFAALVVRSHGWIVGWDVASHWNDRQRAGYSISPAPRNTSSPSHPPNRTGRRTVTRWRGGRLTSSAL